MTTSAAEVAADRLQWLADHSPDAWRLARLASPAVRIEPHLLRSLRVELLPDADVGTEADLWFSPVVESQGVDAIVLDAQTADVLRRDLAGEADLFRRASDIIERAHEQLPPALRLEERINAIALLEGEAAAGRIDDELRTAIRAMTTSPERAGEIARWVLRAWPRLHETVRNTPAAATLALAASTLLRRRMTADPLAARARLTELSWVLPSIQFNLYVQLGVELLDGSLSFVEAASGTGLRVPDTKPPLVELEWHIGGEQQVRVVDAVPGRVVDLNGSVAEVRIGTLDGAEYVVTREAEAADSTSAVGEPEWLDLSLFDAVAEACVRVAPAEPTRTAEWTTAFYIGPYTLATSRWPLEGRERIRIMPSPGDDTFDIVNANLGADVLVMEPATGHAHSEPVQMATPPLQAAAPETGGDLQVEPTRVVILGHDGETLRGVEGLAWVSDFEGREFAVTLDRRTLPAGFVGGPVIASDRVRGLVASIEIRDAAADSPGAAASVVCHIAGASAIFDAYELFRKRRSARAASASASASTQQNAPSEPAQQHAPDSSSPPPPDLAQQNAPADLVEDGAPEFVQSMTSDAGGPRFARIIVVGDLAAGKSELIRALSSDASPQNVDDRCTFGWVERRGRRPVSSGAQVAGTEPLAGGPAGLVFYECTTDRRWPIEIDLEFTALALIVASVIDKPGQSAQAWVRRIQDASRDVPVLVVGAQADANPEIAKLAEREINSIAAGLEIRQGGRSRFEAIEPPRIVSARTRQNVDALRESIIERIDWSAQPRVEPGAFENARASAVRSLSARPPIEGGTTLRPGDPAAGWHDRLAPLTGERRVADGIVVRDPALFEALVLTIIDVADKRYNNVPAARIDEIGRRWPDLSSRWQQLRSLDLDPVTVIRGVAAELERLRLAVVVMAGNTEVIALPFLVGSGFLSQPESSAARILSANWTGEARDVFVALVVRFAWEQGNVRELTWDGPGQRGAAILSDPDLFIQADESGGTARLSVLTGDRSLRLEASRIAYSLREQLESLLPGNASLSFEQGEGSAYMA